MSIRRVVTAAALRRYCLLQLRRGHSSRVKQASRLQLRCKTRPLRLPARAPTQPNLATVAELKAMLRQFLADASTENAAGFDRFFADDVLYTRAAGAMVPKRMIMRSVDNESSRGQQGHLLRGKHRRARLRRYCGDGVPVGGTQRARRRAS